MAADGRIENVQGLASFYNIWFFWMKVFQKI